MKDFKREVLTFTGALLCCFLWGSAFPGIKIGYELWDISGSDTWRIMRFAGVRFFLAGLIVMLFASCARRKLLMPKKKELPKIMLLLGETDTLGIKHIISLLLIAAGICIVNLRSKQQG
ncbi:MAG: hypothetical protein K6F27_03105 [Ruminococcus sp.]|nr:hypothetical protein [Ruminococcus sp.]